MSSGFRQTKQTVPLPGLVTLASMFSGLIKSWLLTISVGSLLYLHHTNIVFCWFDVDGPASEGEGFAQTANEG